MSHPPADPRRFDRLPSPTGLDRRRVTVLIRALVAAGLTVATAESLTGGLLAATLTEIPGSSAVVRGGLIVYATELKHTLAGVDPGLLAAGGPVQAEVARQLADGARAACGADIGIGLTGVAGPDPQDGIAVGTWFVAGAWPGGGAARQAVGPSSAGRAAIRAAAVTAAIEVLEGRAGLIADR